MFSDYGKTLSFCSSKSLFFDAKCQFSSRASCGLLKNFLTTKWINQLFPASLTDIAI